jgi:hypothetical protein
MNKASCLSLISSAVLIWNTVHMSRIAEHLRAAGNTITDADLARVSPLAHAHTIPNGSYFQSPRRRAGITPGWVPSRNVMQAKKGGRAPIAGQLPTYAVKRPRM